MLQVAQEIESEAKFQNDFITQLVISIVISEFTLIHASNICQVNVETSYVISIYRCSKALSSIL